VLQEYFADNDTHSHLRMCYLPCKI